MRSRQSLLCIIAAVVVVITAAGSNAIELVGRATMVQADSIPMGLPGDTVWNFSGVRPLPGSKTWVASKMGDSVLAVACGDSQLTYLERNDSLYWLGFENPSTEMRETGTVRAVRPSAIAAGVQPHKYTGKELDREAGLDLYDFAARQLDPALGRTTTQDPMAEKYYSISPYAWCASNPISNVDPSGMYYNSADSTQAAMYINMLEGRKKALDESDVTDKNEQLAEIDKSLQDIEDMRNDPNRRYTFQEADAPETTVLKDGTILMKISPETGGNFAHEIRHGGQVARGEYGYVKNEPDSRYGASHEISAYRAQLSSYGKISYMPDYGGDKMIELKIAVYGQMHVWKTITNLDEISVNFIMSICEGPGLNVKPIYKYGKEWFGR